VQHREVEGFESELFQSYFAARGGIVLLAGGVATGFKHVEKQEIKRLLHLKGTKTVHTTQVPLECSSLNEGDVFVGDFGDQIYLWFGKASSKAEQLHSWTLARALKGDRGGKPNIVEVAQGSGEQAAFLARLTGDADDILDAEEGGDDAEAARSSTRKLFRLSDASGALTFTAVGEGATVKKAALDSKDVFVLDSGYEVFVWVGKGASMAEKGRSLHYAQDYLTAHGRPAVLPITRVMEGCESTAFDAAFA